MRAICTFVLISVFWVVFFIALVVRELLVLASDDDKVTIFVGHAGVACPWRRDGGIFGNLYAIKVRMIMSIVLRSSLDRRDLQLVKVIEEDSFSLALATEDVDIVVHHAAGVAVSALRNLA